MSEPRSRLHGRLKDGVCAIQQRPQRAEPSAEYPAEDKRYGNVVADLFNFNRKVETRGWEFNAVVVLVEKLVVYKSWSGTPSIHERSHTTNPLGPLQSIGPALTPKPSL